LEYIYIYVYIYAAYVTFTNGGAPFIGFAHPQREEGMKDEKSILQIGKSLLNKVMGLQ
jgi:hypothetical protein